MSQTTSLASLLDPILATLRPAPVAVMPVAATLGSVLAEQLVTPADFPPCPVALVDGYAVASLDLVGASTHSPLMIPPPPLVRAGASLPAGTDAVVDASFVSISAGVAELTDGIAPGTGVRFAGHDLARGTKVAPAGAIVTPEIQLVAQLVGIERVGVRSASVAIAFDDPVLAAWWRTRLKALGCTLVATGADMEIRSASVSRPRLALRPGGSAWVSRENNVIIVEAPPRFDGALAVLFGLVLPIISVWLDSRPKSVARRLTRKIASSIGQTDLVLVIHDESEAAPFATGEATLAALARATGFLLVPPGLEGHAPGETVAVTPIVS